MSSITDLVAEYVEVRSQRLLLEKEVEALKTGREQELKKTILQVMAAQGLKSANVEGLGRVASKERSHFEIFDIEKLCFLMFKNMVLAAQNNRPLSDALLLQRRVHADNLGQLIENQGTDDITSLGVKKVVNTDLSFTKV